MAAEMEALTGASNRFVAFFQELGETFIERDDLLQQIALALLAREHVLMTGPPGTAKSKVAQAVLGRILCEQSRKPSLFARQFTESTVQTDLVGPIDFKTLMDTGRTEHFTDEGMLGAVHAFLDEVFDGRDMLLRSTLNLLHERELKQGTKVSAGKIECALMTTNRYLSEVLENERMLAFVDRIAFLSFVPKGFARPDALSEVLRRQLGGPASAAPRTPLTIQDLDLLQAAVEGVEISEAMCNALASLAVSFDAGLAAARKADPGFLPSRYISTRGVVRLGGLLRASCFYDWAFYQRDRPLEARPQDLARLRLGLTLCGPSLDESARLLERETDPRERRQLGIARTERTIFERCLSELTANLPPPPPRSPANPALLEVGSAEVLSQMTASELVELVGQLAAAGAGRQRGVQWAQAGLEAAQQALLKRALRAGLSPAGDAVERDDGGPGRDPVEALVELARLADQVDAASPGHRRTARWLRGKALERATEIAALGGSPFGRIERPPASEGDVDVLQSVVETHLARAEQLHSLRTALRQAGADEPDPATRDAAWKEALDRMAARMAPDLAIGLTAASGRALELLPRSSLKSRIDAIEPVLKLVRLSSQRLAAMGGDGGAFFTGIVRQPLEQVVQLAWKSLAPDSRVRLAAAMACDVAVLADVDLLSLLPPALLGLWMAEAIVRAEQAPLPDATRSEETNGYRGYRNLRSQMPRATLAYVLVELLTAFPALWQGEADASADPDRVLRRVAEVVRTFPEGLRAELAWRDLAYVTDPLAFLERWWQSLTGNLPGDPAEGLNRLRTSGFFAITHEECALARFDLEARLVATVFETTEVEPLRARLAELGQQSGDLVERLSRRRLPS